VSFADVQETHRQLRLRLRVHAGEQAFAEVTVNIPTGDDDELSFLRLVVWSYVLLQETGRVALRFLKELPPFTSGELLPEVSYLRTWATHNLLPDKDSDRKKLQLAWTWLKQSCGTSTPGTSDEWRGCFRRLSDSVLDTLRRSLVACEAFDGPDDGPRLLDELRRRLDRNWDAYRFDEHLVAAQKRLGFEGIESVPFRIQHLESWRKVVAAAREDSIDRLLEQRIEKDLLDFMNGALPITAREVLARVSVNDSRELGILMLLIRTRARVSRDSADKLLDGITLPLDDSTIQPSKGSS
jgi:hypothetical protein